MASSANLLLRGCFLRKVSGNVVLLGINEASPMNKARDLNHTLSGTVRSNPTPGQAGPLRQHQEVYHADATRYSFKKRSSSKTGHDHLAGPGVTCKLYASAFCGDREVQIKELKGNNNEGRQ